MYVWLCAEYFLLASFERETYQHGAGNVHNPLTPKPPFRHNFATYIHGIENQIIPRLLQANLPPRNSQIGGSNERFRREPCENTNTTRQDGQEELREEFFG